MLYKDDWDIVRKRYIAWWKREIVDRAIIVAYAPRKGSTVKSQWNGWSLIKNLDRTDWVIDEFEKHCQAIFYGGDALPHLFLNLGPGITAAYMGCKVGIAEETVWYHAPRDLSLDDILKIKFDPKKNEWWQITLRLANDILKRSPDKFLCGITDLNAEMNALGSLRNTQRLLMDCVDDADKVKRCADNIHKVWLKCYDELTALELKQQEGTAFWMNIWHPRRCTDVQCDFSAMIGPDMFKQFVLGHVHDTCTKVDGSIFHLDGVTEIPHLHMLLDLPELTGIQWVPGAGKENTGDPKWFPMYKQIQAAGKNLVLQGMRPDQVEGVMKNLDHHGLLMETWCDTQDEAEALVAKVAKWTKD
jgi:5-methyltetrahydrofolate--homocysteine methyltransferase